MTVPRNVGSSGTRRRLNIVLAAVMAAVLGLFTVIGTQPAAHADSSDGWRVSTSYNGTMHDGKPVVEPGKDYRLAIQYPNEPGGSAVLSIPEGVDLNVVGLEPGSTIPAPAGNPAVESLTLSADGRSLTVKLQSEENWPPNIDQGGLILNFQFGGPIEQSAKRTVTWEFPGNPSTIEVYVKGTDWEENTGQSDTMEKTAAWVDFPAPTIEDGKVVVDREGILGKTITFTVKVTSDQARTIDLQDSLEEHLVYVDDSFSATLKTWDEEGITSTTAPFDVSPEVSGTSFALKADVPAQSVLTLTYQVKVAEDQLDAIVADLQAQYDAIDPAEGGSIAWTAKNTAILGDITQEVPGGKIGYTVAKPVQPGPFKPGAAFSKKANPSGDITIPMPDQDGNINPPVQVTYTLRANLKAFEGTTDTLETNVILKDTPLRNVRWTPDAEGFISLEGGELAAYTGNGDDFSSDDNINKYWLREDGQLWVNVGHDTTQDIKIAVKAEIYSVGDTAVTEDPYWNQYVKYHYSKAAANKLEVDYNGTTWSTTVENGLDVRKGGGEEIDDQYKFKKTSATSSTPLVINKGDSANIPFTFTIGDKAVVDLSKSVIVDHIDHNILDVSEENLVDIQKTIKGKYAWWVDLAPEDFTFSLNDDGDLEIRFAEDFFSKNNVANNSYLELSLEIPTKPLNEKKTFSIKNEASLVGGTEEDYTFVSEVEGKASSFGDELETKKLVSVDGQEWSENLRLELDENGELVEDELTYRIDAISHGEFGSGLFVFNQILDPLDSRLEFLGFVDESGNTVSEDGVDLGGNVKAAYDTETRTVSLGSNGLQFTAPDSKIHSLYFKVKLTGWEEGVSIQNAIPGSPTNVTPGNAYPLNVHKVDSDNANNVITDRNARFTVTGPDGVVTDAAYVVDGLLRVDDNGTDKTIMVENPGEYTVSETVPPNGYQKSDESVTIVVDENGNSEMAVFPNTPTVPTPEPELGTFQLQKVVSGVAEADLAGRNFEVTAMWTVEGEKQEQTFQLPATGEKVAGPEVPVGTVVSILEQADREIPGYNYTGTTLSGDGVTESSVTVGTEEGATVTVTNTYEEEEPPAPEPEFGLVSLSKVVAGLDEGVTAGDQDFVFSWSAVAPEGIEFGDVPAQGSVTVKGDAVPVVVSDAAGTPVSFPVGTVVTFAETEAAQIDGYSFDAEAPVFAEGADSVTVAKDETVNAVATNTYIKNTPKTYAIGDYVWIDADKDGEQDAVEDGLPGVKVTLADADGNPIDGVEPQFTDENGRYLFDSLPAGTYTIRFELTEKQAQKYSFTTRDEVAEHADSDADPATGWTTLITLGDDNKALTHDYDREFAATEGVDPTWDAGVILLDKPVTPEPTDPSTPTDPKTPAKETPEPKKPTEKLAVTGAAIGWLAAAAAALLLGGGVAVTTVRTKRSK